MFKSIQDLVKKNYLSCDVADVLREKGINKLTPLQKRVFNDENFWYDGTKDKNGNMIIQGSTSSGKTLVAEISIIDVLTKVHRQTQYIWYHCVLWQQKSIVNLIILWEKH